MPAPTILVVNHDADTREILRFVLRYQGYWTIDVQTAEEVLAAIATERPALIVSELYVPSAEGPCVLGERLRRESAATGVRVLILTSNVIDDEWRQLPTPACDDRPAPAAARRAAARAVANTPRARCRHSYAG